jgi:hypothetical protein
MKSLRAKESHSLYLTISDKVEIVGGWPFTQLHHTYITGDCEPSQELPYEQFDYSSDMVHLKSILETPGVLF